MSIHESLTREIDTCPKGADTAAFFDLDRTIIAGFSALAFLANWIMSGRMTLAGFAKTVLASLRYETGGIGFSAMVNDTSALLKGFDEAEYSALGDKIFEAWLAGEIYPEARAIVRAAMTMLTMPDNVNFLEAIVLPNEQLYIGRG